MNVKRYANRKLYDSDTKQYVTLPNVAQAVRSGQEVKAHDHVTGEDITSRVLAQVIAHEEATSPRVSADVLAKVIREGMPDAT